MMGNAPCMHVDAEFCEKCWPPKEEQKLVVSPQFKDPFVKGFETAINLVRKVVDNSPEKEAEGLWDEIMEEVELYKKDG